MKKSPLPAQRRRPGSLPVSRRSDKISELHGWCKKPGAMRSTGCESPEGTSSGKRGARDTETPGPGASRGPCPRPGAAKHCGVLATATGQNGPDLPHALALLMSRARRESTQGLQTAAHPGHSSSAHPAPAAGDFSVARDPQVQTVRRTRPSPSGVPEHSPHPLPGARGSPPGSTG